MSKSDIFLPPPLSWHQAKAKLLGGSKIYMVAKTLNRSLDPEMFYITRKHGKYRLSWDGAPERVESAELIQAWAEGSFWGLFDNYWHAYGYQRRYIHFCSIDKLKT